MTDYDVISYTENNTTPHLKYFTYSNLQFLKLQQLTRIPVIFGLELRFEIL